jgi:hypothetical protein
MEPDRPFFPSELMQLLMRTIPAKLPVLVTGKPGQGKTDIVTQAAEECEADLIVAHPVVDDPVDYKGMPAIVDNHATFLPFGNLRSLIEANRPTVYFMDDLGQAPKTVQAAAMQLLLARRVNGHKVSGEVTFIAATNRKEDKAGVQGILEPVKDRFVMIVELEPSLSDWVHWALTHQIPHELISFIRYRPNFLSDFKPTFDMTKTPTPRTIAGVGQLMNLGIPKELELRAFNAAAGKEFAIEFTGFLRVYRDLPDPDAVLLDPKFSAIPTEKSSLYALCGALSARANPNNFERFITYIDRLPEEFSVLAVRDAIARDKIGLPKTQAFTQWVTKHHDVLT